MNTTREHGLQLYQYQECGLDNVYLSGGFEFIETQRGKQVIIHNPDGLHKALGKFLVNEKRNLSGKEVRFLRHEMLMSQATMAALLDVAEQTVHRWEAGKTDIPKPAEALIRLLYKEHLGTDGTIKESLRRIANLEDKIDQQRMTLVEGSGGWQMEYSKAA